MQQIGLCTRTKLIWFDTLDQIKVNTISDLLFVIEFSVGARRL